MENKKELLHEGILYYNYELTDQEKNLLYCLNQLCKIQPIPYNDLNSKFFISNKESLFKLEKENPKLGVTVDGVITTLTLIATITDFLTDKRLGVILDKSGKITEFGFVRCPLKKKEVKNVCCNNGW